MEVILRGEHFVSITVSQQYHAFLLHFLPLCFSHFVMILRNHPRPSLPSDVLIALAVRNLDPSNQLVMIHSDLTCPTIPPYRTRGTDHLWIRIRCGQYLSKSICQKNICHITGSLLHAHHCLPVPPLPLLQQAARRMQKHGWLVVEMFSKHHVHHHCIDDILLTKLQKLLQQAARRVQKHGWNIIKTFSRKQHHHW